MNKFFLPVLLVLALSACGTTSGTKATVEDRTGSRASAAVEDRTGSRADAATVTTAATQAGDTRPVSGGAETTALGDLSVAGSSHNGQQLEGSSIYAGDPRQDPASPLSTRSIFFDFDSFVVKDEYRPVLEAHAGYVLSKRGARVILQGNTDERGSREYNLALGQKRAEAVRRALALLGVSDAQMEAVSFGEEKLRNEGDTDEAHAENRRTDVVYADE